MTEGSETAAEQAAAPTQATPAQAESAPAAPARAKKAAPKKASAKKAPTRRAAAKKARAKKVVAKKVPAKKAPAKKAPAKETSGKEKAAKSKGGKGKKRKQKESKKKDAKGKGGKGKAAKAKDAKKSSNKKLSKARYEAELFRLQGELVKLQEWVKKEGLRVVVVFEGRDAAGKGGVIKRIAARMNARVCRITALPAPTEREKTQWYFQRYVRQLPAGGEIVLFDRSWYNRAGVERVMGFCTDAEYKEFLRSCPVFENMLTRSGVILVKYWFSVSDDVQEDRFQERLADPMKRWKFSPMDLTARSRWAQYSRAKDAMFKHTDTKENPWWVVNADIKRHARLNCITHLLSIIPHKAIKYPKVKLPRVKKTGYKRPPMDTQRFVPELY